MRETSRASEGGAEEGTGAGGGLAEVRAGARSSSDGRQEKADHKYA